MVDKKAEQQTILLVEDEVIIARAEQLLLERHGYRVRLAHTGEDAVAMVESARQDDPVDLVLMDIDLGQGIDGTVAAQRILACCPVPVLFLSSHTSPAVVDRTEQITSYGYVVKSASPTVLLASIRMAFRLHNAERAVAEDRDTLCLMMEASPVGMFLVDEVQRVTQANPAAEQMTGRTVDALHQPRCGDFLGCYNRLHHHHGCGNGEACRSCGLYRDILRSLEEREAVVRHQTRFIFRHGDEDETFRSRWLSYSVTPLNRASRPAALVTMQDITDERIAEARMEQLFRHSPEAILIIDADHRITHVNDGFTAITGYTREETVGLLPDQYFQRMHPDDATLLRRSLREALNRQARCMVYRYRFRRADGTWIWVEDRASFFYSSHGELEESYVFMRDIAPPEESGANLTVLDCTSVRR